MLTVILQNVNIEVIKSKRGSELLSSEMVEARKRKNSSEYRPDILHQCLLVLLDSPLNKSGQLKVLVETTTKRVITVNKHIRIPRVYSRFAGLLVQLMERHRIYSESEKGRVELMRVTKDSLESHLSNKSIRVGLSKEGDNFFEFMNRYIKDNRISKNKCLSKSISENVMDTEESSKSSKSVEENKKSEESNNNSNGMKSNNNEYKSNNINDEYNSTNEENSAEEYPFVFYINAVSSGEDPIEEMDKILSVSAYPLAAATCCSKICTEFEKILNIF